MWERRSVAVARLAGHVAAEAGPDLRTLVVGHPDRHTHAVLAATLGPLTVVHDPAEAPAGTYDVGVALDWLHRLRDPAGGLAALARVAGPHLLLAAPRRVGRRWTAPAFLRFVSRHGAVRDTAHPLGETLVWVRRT